MLYSHCCGCLKNVNSERPEVSICLTSNSSQISRVARTKPEAVKSCTEPNIYSHSSGLWQDNSTLRALAPAPSWNGNVGSLFAGLGLAREVKEAVSGFQCWLLNLLTCWPHCSVPLSTGFLISEIITVLLPTWRWQPTESNVTPRKPLIIVSSWHL